MPKFKFTIMRRWYLVSIFLIGLIPQAISQAKGILFDSLIFKNEIDTNQKQLSTISGYCKKVITEIKKTNFHSGVIYFSGYGFPYVEVRELKNKRGLRKALRKCKPGTTIIVDRCVIIKDYEFSQTFSQGIVLK